MFLYNLLTRENIHITKLATNKKLKIYVCGPTLYRKPHIGNFRSVVFTDYINRVLKLQNYQVEIYSSITDIGHCANGQDKILLETKNHQYSNYYDLVAYHYNDYIQLLQKLNINCIKYIPASYLVKENKEHIDNIDQNNIFFDQNNNIRVKQDFITKHSDKLLYNGKRLLEFTIWKQDINGIDIYNNIKGNPGWHLECFSIIKKYFTYNKTYIDIHIGGIDLVDIHNNAEIVHNLLDNNNKILSKSWIAIEQVTLNKKKMSKSHNNVIYIESLLKTYNISIIKMFLLYSHYQNKIDYNQPNINAIQNIYKKIYNKIATIIFNHYQYGNINFLCILNNIKHNFLQQNIQYKIDTRHMINLILTYDNTVESLYKMYQIDYVLNLQIFSQFIISQQNISKLQYYIFILKKLKHDRQKNLCKIDYIKNIFQEKQFKIIENVNNIFIY